MRTVLAAQRPRVYESLPAAAGILRKQGPAGLYAGVGVTLLEIVPASAIQFGVYALLRNIARAEDSQDSRIRESTPRAVSPLANAVRMVRRAGSVARVIIHPLDVVKKRFQVAGLARSLRYGERVAAAEFSSFASAFGTILRKEGVRGFYKGLARG